MSDGGVGIFRTHPSLPRFSVTNATVPPSRSIMSGVTASASEIRQPLHIRRRQNRRGSGGSSSAARAKRWRSAAVRYFLAPDDVGSDLGGGVFAFRCNTMANNVARKLCWIFWGFGEGWNDKRNLSAINAANYSANSMP